MDELLQELSMLCYKEERLNRDLEACSEFIVKQEKKKTKLEESLKTVQEAQTYYKKGVDVYYEESVGFLIKLINAALKEIVTDRDYSLDIILDDKRGKSLKFVLKDGEEEVSLKDGVGMGIRTVISAILHIYCLLELGANYLFIDEKYSYLSEGYVQQFFNFIQKFCKQYDFHLVMISHDPRFFNYVDKAYQVNDGVVVETKA